MSRVFSLVVIRCYMDCHIICAQVVILVMWARTMKEVLLMIMVMTVMVMMTMMMVTHEDADVNVVADVDDD